MGSVTGNAVGPAWTRRGVVPAANVQVAAAPVPLAAPTARPTTTEGLIVPPGNVSTADVSVIDIVPAAPTLNVTKEVCGTPLTAAGTELFSTSVIVAADGVVVEVLE